MTQHGIQLKDYTSLKVGGAAETLYTPESYDEVLHLLNDHSNDIQWVLGYGSNVLISDSGLPGGTLMWHGGSIDIDGDTATVDAGVWWDDFVETTIEHGLWGVELMSGIPSSVGGAVFGNIAAYGQQVSDTLEWIEVYDRHTRKITKLTNSEITFGYRSSSLQQQRNLMIMRACFHLSQSPIQQLKYDSALIIAEEKNYDISTLAGRRLTIIETRRRAGSIYHPNDPNAERTAGSFFKNPLVSKELATELASYDETGKTIERIQNQSKIHGGSDQRVSAAYVLFAAGYQRGQTWDKVRLHPRHVLKVETLPGATAQEVFDVSTEIVHAVKHKLDIDLEPEVKFLGNF